MRRQVPGQFISGISNKLGHTDVHTCSVYSVFRTVYLYVSRTGTRHFHAESVYEPESESESESEPEPDSGAQESALRIQDSV